MKAQVATTVSPESEMLLKTIGALPRACGREPRWEPHGRTPTRASTDLKGRSLKAGLPPRTPRRMGYRPRCFNPSLPTRHTAGSSLHQPGGKPAPRVGPLAAIRPGTHRAATDVTEQRTTQLSRPDGPMQYTFQAGHAGSIPVARSRRQTQCFECCRMTGTGRWAIHGPDHEPFRALSASVPRASVMALLRSRVAC